VGFLELSLFFPLLVYHLAPAPQIHPKQGFNVKGDTMKGRRIREHLKQPSTWKGLGVLGGLLGWGLAPEGYEVIGQAVILLVGLYEAARNENK